MAIKIQQKQINHILVYVSMGYMAKRETTQIHSGIKHLEETQEQQLTNCMTVEVLKKNGSTIN